MNLNEKVREIAEKSLPDPHHFIVGAKVTGKGRTQKIVVIADGDAGIDIDTCAKISSRMSELLDAETFFNDAYTLEVGSPGADEPIELPRQYTKNIGRKLQVLTTEGVLLEAQLLSVSDNGLTLQKSSKKKKNASPELVEFRFEEIKKAQVIIDFKALKEAEEKDPLPTSDEDIE
ncbi:MAG: ribosome maturation factor RimP [Cytophagaceae bacterium]|jgi:ribosome maturation factor RimP|nr:ribosome maturation factor RimP [Cytophagaceae bacterium]